MDPHLDASPELRGDRASSSWEEEIMAIRDRCATRQHPLEGQLHLECHLLRTGVIQQSQALVPARM